MLDQRKTCMGSFIIAFCQGENRTVTIPLISFLLQSMRGMICSNEIQSVVKQSCPQGLLIKRRFYGGVAFNSVSQFLVVETAKMEMVDAYFSRDLLFFQRDHVTEKLQFFFC